LQEQADWLSVENKMNLRKRLLRTIGGIFFYAGIILGILLFGSSVWADLESNYYFGHEVKGQQTANLTCSPILTVADSKSITVLIHNTSDKLVTPSIQADISNNLAIRSERTNTSVSAHQTVPVTWQLKNDDVVFGHLILVHIFQYPVYTLPSADAYCGIIFLNLATVTGMELYILVLLGTLLGIISGLMLWVWNSRPIEGQIRQQLGGMILLTILVVIGLLFSWIGWWGPGVIILVLSFLMVFVLLLHYLYAK
jgi:hypothetical protein